MPPLVPTYLLDILDFRISAFIHEIAAVVVECPRGARCAPPAICEVHPPPRVVHVADEVIVVGESPRCALHDMQDTQGRAVMRDVTEHNRVIPYAGVRLACDEFFKCLHHLHHPPRKLVPTANFVVFVPPRTSAAASPGLGDKQGFIRRPLRRRRGSSHPAGQTR